MLHKIFKTENIIKVSPEETLSHVVSLLSSSHDSAFVMNDQDQLLGIINPYYCMIKKSYPANTKAKHCLFHAPKVDIKTPLPKVIQLMIETRVHYLPVYENAKLKGIISARRILNAIKNSPQLKGKVGDYATKKQTLISVFEDDFISKAMNLFKTHKVSKLVVISRDFKLKGVLAYYDLISYLATPVERPDRWARVAGKVPRLRQARVRNFMKTQVLTVSSVETLNTAAQLILEHGIGSVIVADAQSHPIGILTTRDLLSVYLGKEEGNLLRIVAKGLTAGSNAIVSTFATQIDRVLKKQRDIINAILTVKEKKKGSLFEAILSIIPRGRGTKVIHTEGKRLEKVLFDVKKKAKRAKKQN